MTDLPKIPLTVMTERTSANGKRYFSGLLGNAMLLMFRNPDGDNEYGESWNLLIQERKPKGNSKPRAAKQRQQEPVSSEEFHRPPQQQPFLDDDMGF